MKYENASLSEYLDLLQTKGRYTFTGDEALASLGMTPVAFKLAALRLIRKNKLIRPKHGFYVIVPTEYQEIGAPPAAWFIDYLMQFNQQPYYVGLLSAAALHGAAHQQPQVFQVITNKSLRPIQAGRTRIEFFIKKQIVSRDYQLMKTPTGTMNVSIPELTALDLVRYVKSVGHINQVTTVLSELHEKFEESRFSKLLKSKNVEITSVQRLGYLLEKIEGNEKIIILLKEWTNTQRLQPVPLRPDKPYNQSQKNNNWSLYINEDIESDI